MNASGLPVSISPVLIKLCRALDSFISDLGIKPKSSSLRRKNSIDRALYFSLVYNFQTFGGPTFLKLILRKDEVFQCNDNKDLRSTNHTGIEGEERVLEREIRRETICNDRDLAVLHKFLHPIMASTQ